MSGRLLVLLAPFLSIWSGKNRLLSRELKILNFSPAIQYLEEVAWANRGKIYQGPIILQPNDDHKTPFMIMATPVYEESMDESHPKATGNLDGVLLFKIDLAQFTGHYCANIRSGRTGYCWVQHLKSLEETIRRESRIIGDALDRGSLDLVVAKYLLHCGTVETLMSTC